jgi:hypothetical protein
MTIKQAATNDQADIKLAAQVVEAVREYDAANKQYNDAETTLGLKRKEKQIAAGTLPKPEPKPEAKPKGDGKPEPSRITRNASTANESAALKLIEDACRAYLPMLNEADLKKVRAFVASDEWRKARKVA